VVGSSPFSSIIIIISVTPPPPHLPCRAVLYLRFLIYLILLYLPSFIYATGIIIFQGELLFCAGLCWAVSHCELQVANFRLRFPWRWFVDIDIDIGKEPKRSVPPQKAPTTILARIRSTLGNETGCPNQKIFSLSASSSSSSLHHQHNTTTTTQSITTATTISTLRTSSGLIASLSYQYSHSLFLITTSPVRIVSFASKSISLLPIVSPYTCTFTMASSPSGQLFLTRFSSLLAS
jgi:hypothetical protein